MIFTSYFIIPETKALNSLIKLSCNSLYIDALPDKISQLYINILRHQYRIFESSFSKFVEYLFLLYQSLILKIAAEHLILRSFEKI